MKAHEKLIERLSLLVAYYTKEEQTAGSAAMAAYYRGRVAQAEYTLEFIDREFELIATPERLCTLTSRD